MTAGLCMLLFKIIQISTSLAAMQQGVLCNTLITAGAIAHEQSGHIEMGRTLIRKAKDVKDVMKGLTLRLLLQ